MIYTEWLKSVGCSHGLDESEAATLAEPPAAPPSKMMPRISGAVVHHSATRTGNAACFRVLHRGFNGWNDIGYHFVIGNGSHSADGQIEKGRKLPYAGAHAKGANHNTVGICLVGCFNTVHPSPGQMRSLGDLLSRLMDTYGFAASAVTIHRMVNGSITECPGRYLALKEVLETITN